jgi:hypothetical protein
MFSVLRIWFTTTYHSKDPTQQINEYQKSIETKKKISSKIPNSSFLEEQINIYFRQTLSLLNINNFPFHNVEERMRIRILIRQNNADHCRSGSDLRVLDYLFYSVVDLDLVGCGIIIQDPNPRPDPKVLTYKMCNFCKNLT